MTAKDNLVRFRVTDAEKALLQAAADREGLTLSAYVRRVALLAARREAKK